MHFYAGLLVIPHRAMSKAIDVDCRSQLAIHSYQQVPIEGSRHAEGIVVREQQSGARLHEIDAQQQDIALLDAGSHVVEKRRCPRWIEVPDIGSKECHERPSPGLRGRVLKSGIVGRSMRENSDAIRLAYPARSSGECT